MSKHSQISTDSGLDTCVIPENFVDTGRCFNGMFRTRNLIEGALLAIPIAHFAIQSTLPMNQKIITIAIFAGGILILFINGINGDSVSEFVLNVFFYNKKKRVAKYNPRVKSEATPGYLTKEQGELPRDKILRILGEINNTTPEDEESVSRDIYDPMYQEFFADDIGYVDTPTGLKTKRELHSELKELKRKEREEIANKKRESKLAAIEAKKEKKKKNTKGDSK